MRTLRPLSAALVFALVGSACGGAADPTVDGQPDGATTDDEGQVPERYRGVFHLPELPDTVVLELADDGAMRWQIDGCDFGSLAEARWTLIPWRHSFTDALAEAKQTKRPIYLYVNDGDVDSGRC